MMEQGLLLQIVYLPEFRRRIEIAENSDPGGKSGEFLPKSVEERLGLPAWQEKWKR